MTAIAPSLNNASVNPPMSSAPGAKVFSSAPRSRGTIISPPGIFSTLARIFIALL